LFAARVPDRDFVPDELIVGLPDPDPSGHVGTCRDAQRRKYFDAIGADVVEEYALIAACRIRFRKATTPGILTLQAEKIGLRTDLFRAAEPNHIVHLEQSPVTDDPFLKDQWGIYDIEAPAAWVTTTGKRSVSVAVIDSGIEYGHPDLAANVDTTRSYNFVDKNSDARDTSTASHGTMVAGVIGAVTNNKLGVAGTNWYISMLALKVARARRGTAVDVAQAIRYAAIQKVDVVNMSFSLVDDDPYIKQEIEAAKTILFVAAAATNGGKAEDLETWGGYPCVYDLDNLLCVTSVDQTRNLASSWGATVVDLAAPGIQIRSTFRTKSYRLQNGTSMAAPFVSGVAALIRSACPGIDIAALRASILTGNDFTYPNGRNTVTGQRVSARLALEASFGLSPTCALETLGSATISPQ
jgi:subtilisin family serine protease